MKIELEANTIPDEAKPIAQIAIVRNARLMASAPKLYQKAYEVADNLLIHLMTPYQTIEIHRDEVAAMVKDLQSALSEAAGEEVANG